MKAVFILVDWKHFVLGSTRKALLAPKVLRCRHDNVQDIPEPESGDHRCMWASLIWGLASVPGA